MNNNQYQKSNYPNAYNSGKRAADGKGNAPQESAEAFFYKLSYNKIWITGNATPELIAYAEKAGEFMANRGLTNSKIRSIYGEIKRIQMGVFEKEKSAFYLLKPKVAYALGRDENNQGLKLFKLIFDKAWADVSDQKSYQNFCNFVEAILAYHRAIGGQKVSK